MLLKDLLYSHQHVIIDVSVMHQSFVSSPHPGWEIAGLLTFQRPAKSLLKRSQICDKIPTKFPCPRGLTIINNNK